MFGALSMSKRNKQTGNLDGDDLKFGEEIESYDEETYRASINLTPSSN